MPQEQPIYITKEKQKLICKWADKFKIICSKRKSPSPRFIMRRVLSPQEEYGSKSCSGESVSWFSDIVLCMDFNIHILCSQRFSLSTNPKECQAVFIRPKHNILWAMVLLDTIWMVIVVSQNMAPAQIFAKIKGLKVSLNKFGLKDLK